MLHVASLEAAACIACTQHASVHGLALMLHRALVLCLVNVFLGQCNPEQQPFATCHVGCNACHDF